MHSLYIKEIDGPVSDSIISQYQRDSFLKIICGIFFDDGWVPSVNTLRFTLTSQGELREELVWHKTI